MANPTSLLFLVRHGVQDRVVCTQLVREDFKFAFFRTRETARCRVGFELFFSWCCCSVFRCFGRPKTCPRLSFCSYQHCSGPISPIRRTAGTRRCLGRRIRGAAWRRGLVCLFPWHFSAACRCSLKIFRLQIQIREIPKIELCQKYFSPISQPKQTYGVKKNSVYSASRHVLAENATGFWQYKQSCQVVQGDARRHEVWSILLWALSDMGRGD